MNATFNANIEQLPLNRPYKSAYELGEYLSNTVLNGIKKHSISREYRLWNWLSLYLFDLLCPAVNGRRSLLEYPAYILDKEFVYQRYYRHLVRSAWVLVSVHGEYSKVLLTPGSANHSNPVAIRTDLQMQLSATQGFVESHSVVKAAYSLYYDTKLDKLKSGSSTKGDGSPRRLVAVLNQFDLTYDLHASPDETIVKLMPTDFKRFKGMTANRI